jgi:hypothetical protein
VNDRNWTYRMPMTVEALSAEQETADRLHRLSVEAGRSA